MARKVKLPEEPVGGNPLPPLPGWKQPRTVPVYVRLDSQIYDLVAQVAERDGVTMAGACRRIIAAFFNAGGR